MNKQQERLNEVCAKAEISMRDLRQLVLAVFIDDENYQKRIVEAKSQQVNSLQLSLMEIQTRNELMRQTMLERKLSRMMWWVRLWSNITKKFKRNGLEQGKRKN